MAIELVPGAHEPYGSRRRQRGVLARAAALVVLASLVAVVVEPPPPPTPPRPPEIDNAQLRWITSLVEGPPRGAVAVDASFTDDLARRIEELSAASESPAFEEPGGQAAGQRWARVLFADDVAGRRIALVAIRTVEVGARAAPSTRLLWLAGPAGASPLTLGGAVESLVPASGTEYRVSPATPFAYAEFGDPGRPVRVAVAPPGCEVQAAPSEDLTIFAPEPTGSYLVRTPVQYRPEYWRVTCDGVVREDRPAPHPEVTDDVVDVVMAGAVGGPDRLAIEIGVRSLYQTFGFELLQTPQVLWAGPVAAARSGETTGGEIATVLAAPAARGGWIGRITIPVEPAPNQTWTLTPFFVTSSDLDADDGVLATPLGFNQLVLVLAPEGAASVRLVGPTGSDVLAEGAVTERALLLSLPDAVPVPLLRIEALDGEGMVVAAAPMAETLVEPDGLSAWR